MEQQQKWKKKIAKKSFQNVFLSLPPHRSSLSREFEHLQKAA